MADGEAAASSGAGDGDLRQENAELRRRIAIAESELAELRAEAIERRRAVREMAESLPTTVSRRAVLLQMARDVRHHPDKSGVARRGVAKLWRGGRKLGRGVRRLAGRASGGSRPRS